ncbi:hypothetical protein C8A05DRAFT_19540 [Staphylotrichum tortipilum]|uniref:Secreted protein n=1 Tax=Staphylotrichum tortipilum TaxID=2831512 RepID=A0AAN6RNM3_9PEZI|nr:hypothetical protein C8A05DRAFT_19540 [Staphylotrichum longicolle]
MQLINTVTLLAGLAAASPVIVDGLSGGPSGHEVQITGLAFAGSGCPAGSVSGQLSSDLTTLTLLYANFVAQAGNNISPSNYRKNCQLNVKLKYPSGWQFSVFKADYRGYAQIPSGDTGTCKATYYFSGDSRQVWLFALAHISSTMIIKGPFDDNYLKTDQFGVESTVWSPCGVEGLLNINSEVRLSPQDAVKPALLTVDSTDLRFKQIHYLQWQTCKN